MHRTLSGRILFGFFAIAIFVQDSVADEYTFTSEKGLSVTRQLEDGVKCDFRNGKTTPYYRERYKVSGHAPRKLGTWIFQHGRNIAKEVLLTLA